MDDLISRRAAIQAIMDLPNCPNGFSDTYDKARIIGLFEDLPSAEPDFSCDGCMTPKYICGICMRNYPNITDHYCTGEAWREAKDETAV